MCRELNREPAWVAAIKLALTRGRVDVESIVEETNLVDGRERTVRDILETMTDREMLVEAGEGEYLVGPVLRRAAPSPSAVDKLSKSGVHQWEGARTGTHG
jgi:hypothetical protein